MSRDVDAEIEKLQKAFQKEVYDINRAALAHQDALRTELQQSKDEQIANLQVCRIRLQRQIEKLEREKFGTDLKIGPIVNLPTELLGLIFHYHVDNGMSPWGPAKVCKSWKNAALSTPHLWRYISIAPALSTGLISGAIAWIVDGERQISKKNRQICSTGTQLLAALQRSGTVPLKIQAESMSTCTPPVLVTLFSLLWLLLRDPASARIESLDLTEWPIQRVASPRTIQVGSFALLSSIDITNNSDIWVRELFDSIDSTACGLEQLSVDSAISEALAERSFWPRIKILRFKEPTYVGQFNDIAKKLVSIEELPLCPPLWPNEGTPISTWAYIQKLELKCAARYLDRLRLPNLDRLIFTDSAYNDIPHNDVPTLSFPNLLFLGITTPNPQWFSNVSAPSLSGLILHWVTNEASPREAAAFFQNELFSHIQYIRLRTSNDRELLYALENASNLCTVEVLSRDKDQTFGLELLERLDATQLPILCPKLDSLELGSRAGPIFTLKKNGVPLIKRIVSSRKKIKTPLTEFSVCWHKSSYKVDDYA